MASDKVKSLKSRQLELETILVSIEYALSKLNLEDRN